MDGTRHALTSVDDVRIGLLTAGAGPALLLVHGGIENWLPVWPALTTHRRVTAMDRRGRGTSSDAGQYSLSSEYADVAAIATAIAGEQGEAVDVMGHSFGATCVLGAAAAGAPFRRIVLYEPPGPEAVPDGWPERVSAMVADGQVGRAALQFLTEIIGLTREQVYALRDAPGGRDVLPIFAATIPREAHALAAVDLVGAAHQVSQPTLLLLGTQSPAWAGHITTELAGALSAATVRHLAGAGHNGLDEVPDAVAAEVLKFTDP